MKTKFLRRRKSTFSETFPYHKKMFNFVTILIVILYNSWYSMLRTSHSQKQKIFL